MKLLSAAVAALIACSAQATDFGTLGALPWAGGFDFHYKPAAAAPYSALGLQYPKVLYSQFTYNGQSGTMQPQHVLMAYTQRLTTDGLTNVAGELQFSHGAGAIVSENGLGLELWFRPFNGAWGTPNAYVWDQTANRCLRDVQGTVPANTLCLPDYQNSDAYVTPAPDFQLRRNKPYGLRITYTPNSGWVTMHAELWDNSTGTLIQQAQVSFQANQFFPDGAQALTPVLGRTPGTASEPNVSYAFTAVK